MDVDDAFAVKEWDNHQLPNGPPLLGLLGFSTGHCLSVITVDPVLITGDQGHLDLK